MTPRPTVPRPHLSAAVVLLSLLGAAHAQTEPVQATPAPAQNQPAQNQPAQALPVQTTPPLPGAQLSLSRFFQPLLNYPSLVQARLALAAAQTQQNAASFPVSASVSGNLVDYASVEAAPAICDTTPVALLTPTCYPVGGVGGTLNVAVSLTSPLPVGDVAARQQQAAVTTSLAQVSYAATLSTLEGQALLAARRVRLGESNLALATRVQAAAELTVQTVQTQLTGGGATATDLTQSQLTLARAQSGALQAQEDLTLARAGLQDLTGSPAAPDLSDLAPPVTGTPVGVLQAQLGLRRALITQAQVRWNTLPAVQANYTHYTSDTSGIGLSLDSRTLSPAVNFTYSPRAAPLNRVRDQFSLGLNFDASASALAAPGLAQNAADQAQAGLDTARRQAELQLAALNNALTQAQRQQTLAAQVAALAQQQLQDASTRADLGLSAPLAVAQSGVAAYQAQLALSQAQLAETDAVLKLYSFFALPLDQVSPAR